MQNFSYLRETRGVVQGANRVLLNRTIMGRNYYNNLRHYAEILPKVLKNANKIGVAGPTSFFQIDGHAKSTSRTDHGAQKSKVEPRMPFAKPSTMWRVSTVPLPLTSEINNPRNMTYLVTKVKHSVFKCPWQCFWKCHSYCPQRCCNNPYNCHITCGEWCGETCSDVCCAPGLERMAPFKPTPKPKVVLPPPIRVKPQKLITGPRKGVTNNHDIQALDNEISFITQLDVLRKATTEAANKIGLPPGCPAICVQVCVPGWCQPHCCLGNLMLLRKGLANSRGNALAHKLAEQYLPSQPPARTFPFLKRVRKLTAKEIMEAKRQHLLQLQRNHRIPSLRLNHIFVAPLPVSKNFKSNGDIQRTSGVTNYVTKIRNFARKAGRRGSGGQFTMDGSGKNIHVLENAGKRFLSGKVLTPRYIGGALASAQSALAYNNAAMFRRNALNNQRLIDNAINRQIYSENRELQKRKVAEAQRVLYNDLAFDNQLKKQNLLFNKNAAALVQEIARKSDYCSHPEMCPKTLSRIIHTCPKVCSLSCVPQCPTRCCIISKGLPPIGLSFPTDDYQ